MDGIFVPFKREPHFPGRSRRRHLYRVFMRSAQIRIDPLCGRAQLNGHAQHAKAASMLDLLFLAGVLAFFGLSAAAVRACDRL